MKKTKQIIRLIFINSLIFLVLLIIVDFVLGRKNNNRLGLPRHIMLREHRINSERFYNLEKKKYRLSTDNNGFILGTDNENIKDSVDILFLGGSTTECMFMDETNRFPYLVQEKLAEALGKEISTLNGGVSGNNIMHSTLILLTKGIPIHPKIIVLMHNINDLAGLIVTGSYYKQPGNRSLIQSPSTNNIRLRIRYLLNAIIPNIYLKLRNKFSNAMFFSNGKWEKVKKSEFANYELIESEFRKAICSFINIAKAHNIKVILMTQFNRMNMSEKKLIKQQTKTRYEKDKLLSMINIYPKLNETIKQIARENEVGIIDLAKQVPGNKQYIYDLVHLNAEGSILVSDIITEYILTNNYLK